MPCLSQTSHTSNFEFARRCCILTFGAVNNQEPNLQAILQAIEADSQHDVDNAIVQERNRDMRAVKRDLEVLKDATKDVASLVVDQGDQLAIGQRRTERAKMAVETGTRELKLARSFKSKSRVKCYLFACCLFCIVLLGAAAAFLLLYNQGEYWTVIVNYVRGSKDTPVDPTVTALMSGNPAATATTLAATAVTDGTTAAPASKS